MSNFIKLKKPNFFAIGQGNAPEFLIVKKDKKVYQLRFGDVFKLSSKCDSDFEIADLEAKPYPLVHEKFYERLKNQFEEIGIKS